MMNLGTLLAEVTDLVAPRRCAGCDRAGTRWCLGCAQWFSHCGPIERRLAPDLPVFAAGEYAGPVRAGICAWKESQRVDLTRVWAAALRPVIDQLPPAGYCLVPVPSTSSAQRRRGWRPATELARALTGMTQVPWRPALTCVRAAGDQVGLSRIARQQNIAGAFGMKKGWLHYLAGRKIIIIDDVITTGATVAEAHRALAGVQAEVIAAITIAATPGRQPGGSANSSGLDLPNSPDLA